MKTIRRAFDGGRELAYQEGELNKIDIIMETFSKSSANIGGVVGDPAITQYLQYQSRQYAFSAATPPSISKVTKSLKLIDEEARWKQKLWDNILYFTNGLISLGLNIGSSTSANIPMKVANPERTCQVGTELLNRDIYTNFIMYPTASIKDCRRMSILASHNKNQLDLTLNAFDDIKTQGFKLNK